jgi:predicted double-glycine peptidase
MRTLILGLLLGCCACSGYAGKAHELRPDAFRSEPGWMFVRHVPMLRQRGDHDCGPTALAMVVSYYRPELRDSPLLAADPNRRASAGDLRDRARALGLHAFVVEGEPEDLVHELQRGRPVIVGMAKPTIENKAVSHFEVVIGMHAGSRRVATFDPAEGWRQNSLIDFMTEWQSTGRVLLVVMPPADEDEKSPPPVSRETQST